MSQPAPLVDRRLPRQLIRIQALMIPAVVLLAWGMAGTTAASNAAAGAVLAWAGSAYFAWQAFRQAGARQARQVVGQFYRGMIGKFVLTVLGFIVIFAGLRPLSAPWVLAGFALVQGMAWVYPLWKKV